LKSPTKYPQEISNQDTIRFKWISRGIPPETIYRNPFRPPVMGAVEPSAGFHRVTLQRYLNTIRMTAKQE